MPLLLAALEPEVLFNAVWQTALVIGVVFVLLTLLFSHLKYEHLAEQAAARESAGLSPLDAFRLQVARYVGTLHKDPPPFTLALVGLDDLPALRAEHGEAGVEAVVAELARRLRAKVRAGDVALRVGQDQVGLALPMPSERSGPVLRRLVEEVAADRVELPSRARVQMRPVAAAALFPLHGGHAEQLRLRAQQALTDRLAQTHGDAVVLPPDTPSPAPPPTDEAPAPAPHLDPLTGVLALKEIGPALQKFLAHYRKDGLPVTFLYLDVDALESYNSHYGRAAGDTILKALCRLLERHTRIGDLIGRLEGEEFVIAMACAPAEATLAAQRLAALVKREQVDFGQNKLRVTVSIGVAGYPDHGAIARLLYERAEMALYDAKARGRNAVSVYAPHMSLPRSPSSRRASAEAY
jgi:diguanylate cyclase (GGDEF)-like protein